MWLLWSGAALAAIWGGGDYAGADISLADGDLVEGVLTNVGVFIVPAGARVRVSQGVPLVVEAVEVVIEGHLDADLAGEPPAGRDLAGLGLGGGGWAVNVGGDRSGGEGGGGYGGRGGHGASGWYSGYWSDSIGGPGGPGGARHGSHADPLDAALGSSGSSPQWGLGGAGGGSVTLIADAITLSASGRISANGGAAGRGDPSGFEGGGGGSGGAIVLDAAIVAIDGGLSAEGGGGEDATDNFYASGYYGGGGGGGGGRIKILGAVSGVLPPPRVSGGHGGVTAERSTMHPDGSRGGVGTVYVESLVAGPPTLGLVGSCGPGISAEVTGASGYGQVLVLTGTQASATALPADSPCPGFVTAIGGDVQRFKQVADALGTTDRRVGCGDLVQVVDLWSCTASPVVAAPSCYGDTASGDSDDDGICDDLEGVCVGEDHRDPDQDGVPTACDPCPNTPLNDSDGDLVCDDVDICAGGDDLEDPDLDAVPSFCDGCPDEYDPMQGSRWESVPGADPLQQLASLGGARVGPPTDLDGDGDLDVLAFSIYDEVLWYENLGGGAFGPEQVITTLASLPTSVHAADLDGDGAVDVLSASLFDNEVAWYQNLGGGVFGAQQIVSTLADDPQSVYAADLDGDADLDVLSASDLDDEVAWYSNLGGGVFGAQQKLSSTADGANEALAVDVDLDGDQDVVWCGSAEVAWKENLGGTFGARQVVAAFPVGNSCETIEVEDLDGDGDADLLAGFEFGPLAWHENVGGTFGPQQVVSPLHATEVRAADLDGDGDADVLRLYSYGLYWYENLGGTFGPEQHIAWMSFAGSLATGDLDGDADVEILSDNFGAVLWIPNQSAQLPLDTDTDGVCDASDVCPDDADPDQLDTDGDGLGDVCDP